MILLYVFLYEWAVDTGAAADDTDEFESESSEDMM
jgi:hypothetical protein